MERESTTLEDCSKDQTRRRPADFARIERSDHRRFLAGGAAAALLLLASCITINVYFPAKQIEEAAEEIVGEVRPDIVSADETGETGETGDGREVDDSDPGEASAVSSEPDAPAENARAELSPLGAAVRGLFVVRSAHAEDKDAERAKKGGPDLKVSTPKIKKIKAALKARYRKLLPLYKAGRVGEGHDGYLAVRDVKRLGLRERRAVTVLVQAENASRKDLYLAIARANGIDEKKLAGIAALFAKSWQKSCKTGWWIEPKKGRWQKKKPPPPPKKKPPKRGEDEPREDGAR